MWGRAMIILWVFQFIVIISGQDSSVIEDVQVWKFSDGEPANLTVFGDTGNGCKFVLQTDEDRTCCYMNKEVQKDPDYNICRDQQSIDCISKSRFAVSEPKGKGQCILTLTKFQKSDAGTYIVKFPNERRNINRRKKIEIQERKYEIKEIVVGQTATIVFKGDIGKDGCKFMAYLTLSSKTCCYEDKRRQSCKQENKCVDYRNSSSYEVKEDGNKCLLFLRNFQTSDVGEYEVIFSGDKNDNEIFQMKEVSSGVQPVWIVFMAVLAAVLGYIGFRLAKYRFRKPIEDEKLKKGSLIFDALHNLNPQLFKERLGSRHILRVRDSNKNNLFHKVADKNWTTEMTNFLRNNCDDVFKEHIQDPENREMNSSNSPRQQILCAGLPHKTSRISMKSHINSRIIKVFGHGQMEKFCQIILPITYIDLNSQNESGKTPLHIAADKNELDLVKVLLENGVNPNIKDNHNCTPLQRAVLNQQCENNKKPNNIEIVELLLKKASPMSKTVNGQNILHSAVMKNNLDVIKLIIKYTNSNQQDQLLEERYSKEVTERKTKNKKVQWTGKTPLELAAKFGHKEIVECLVKENKLWNTVEQNRGMRPIYTAVYCCQKEVLTILMQNGGKFDPTWIVDEDNLKSDNCMRKVIRDRIPGAVNILLGFPLIKLDKSQIDEAIQFAETEENELVDNESKETEAGNIHFKNGTNKEKLACIIKALKRKNQSISLFKSDEVIHTEIRKVQATKRDILKNIKTLEKERDEARENYKKDKLDQLIKDKNKEVEEEIRLRSMLKSPREEQAGPNNLTFEQIRARMKTIEDDESPINQKKMKQIMQLLEQKNKGTWNKSKES